jgi:eukaryotic-like serine/threonine-protein kinase
MTPEVWERVKELFEAALERGPQQRPAFLAEACGQDAAVRAEVERLLSEHEQAGGSFLLQSGKDLAGLLPTLNPAQALPPAEGAEASLGEFRVLRLIGRGGMGSVYEAYQQSMRRRVALKVLDAAVLSPAGEGSRFEREAWIGGRLSHPNIVKVYGQGEVGRLRYFAMELVEGESLAAEIQREKGRRGQRTEGSGRRAGHVRRMVSLFVGWPTR